MNKSGFSYSKWTAVVAVLAMTVIGGERSSTATKRPPATIHDAPNLSSEARTVDSFNDDLVRYDKKRVELSKKTSLTNEEFNSMERTGNDLKRRVSELKAATQSIVQKLKAAGRWDNLDEEILAKLTDAKDRAFVRDNGGLRHILESAGADLNSQSGDEIVAPLKQLKSKVAQSDGDRFGSYNEAPWRIVAASYRPPSYRSPMPMIRSLRCIGATIRFGVGIVIHGTSPAGDGSTVPPSTKENYACHCFNDCANAPV